MRVAPPPRRCRIYLIRHPRPAAAEGLCYGASELDLAEDAAACAALLKRELPPKLPLFSSPMRRCRLLAQHLHPQPAYDARLREMHFGAWEMRPWNDLPRDQLDAWAAAPLDYVPPGGESVAALRARVADFIAERSRDLHGDYAVVAHAGVMKIFAAVCQQLEPAEWFKLQFEFGRMAVMEYPEAGV
ncbi:MAG: histidine phosphatase family protein [Rhodocyclaceae bacterium]|nr:histidine phosphatase family protein [Rhodocyclaceae bacterium]MBX3669663.1 histidine phosphatase family protein [Rhodocyclaceae bacterium]